MKKTPRIVVLLSGGQDSTTCLFWAKAMYPEAEVHALTLFYGQRHQAEVSAAEEIGKLAGVSSHAFMSVPVLSNSASALTDPGAELKSDGGLKDREAPNGLPTSFVPGRNLVFLALAAAHAGALGASVIVTGVCETDYSGYPDCREKFIDAMNGAINAAWPSGEFAPLIMTPLMRLTKRATVELAQQLPGCMEALALSVTCYNGQRPGCGKCPACELRAKGFAEAGVVDPSAETS